VWNRFHIAISGYSRAPCMQNVEPFPGSISWLTRERFPPYNPRSTRSHCWFECATAQPAWNSFFRHSAGDPTRTNKRFWRRFLPRSRPPAATAHSPGDGANRRPTSWTSESAGSLRPNVSDVSKRPPMIAASGTGAFGRYQDRLAIEAAEACVWGLWSKSTATSLTSSSSTPQQAKKEQCSK
jgi:hypothetical protein